MNENNSQKNINPEVSSIATEILMRIESQSIKPTSRFRFICTEWGVWILWLTTIIFGAAALAVSIYVTMSANYAFYEATHENFLTFFIAVMPYVWVCLFFGMVYTAVFEMRNTKRGYRYSSSFIVISSLTLTVLGAVLLHCFGLGYTLDKKLGEQISMYMSMEKMEQKMWQNPEDGRLIGELIKIDNSGPNFFDSAGLIWQLSLSELTPLEISILQTGVPVKLFGTSTAEGIFHVCGVFLQQKGRARAWQEMNEERQNFFSTIHARRDQVIQNNTILKQNESRQTSNEHICVHLEMMKRVK